MIIAWVLIIILCIITMNKGFNIIKDAECSSM